jgi:hypothetical protein
MKWHKILFCQHFGIFDFIYSLFIVTEIMKFLVGFTGGNEGIYYPEKRLGDRAFLAKWRI